MRSERTKMTDKREKEIKKQKLLDVLQSEPSLLNNIDKANNKAQEQKLVPFMYDPNKAVSNNSNENLLYFLISRLDHGNGCTASNRYLGINIKASPTTVSRLIGRLKEKGLIKIKREKFEFGKKRTIFVISKVM